MPANAGAEAEVPLAISEAFRSGRLGVMDYYNLRNLQADTQMRNAISGSGVNDRTRRVATFRSSGRSSGRSGSPAEVLGRDRVEKLPELLDLVFLLVGDGHARLVQDLVAGEDLRAGAQRQRDRVLRARAHLGPVGEDQVRVEDPVPQRGDVHRAQLDIQDLEHVTEKIVRERPKGNHALLGEGNRRCLDCPDPAGQVPVALRLLEQDDGAV